METIIGILSWIILSFVVYAVANTKGRSGCAWFFISILLSPLIAIIILLCVGDSDEKKQVIIRKAVNEIESEKTRRDNELEGSMTQDKAIEELQKAKQMLELEVISQAEYDAKKAELMPYLRDNHVPQTREISIVEEAPQKVITINHGQKPIEYKWYEKTWVQILIICVVISLFIGSIFIVEAIISNKKELNKALKPNTSTLTFTPSVQPKIDLSRTQNYQDNSQEHQKFVTDKFIANLFKLEDHLHRNWKLKYSTCSFNKKTQNYDVCVCYENNINNKLYTEIYKGDVFVSIDGEKIRYGQPYRANFKTDNNDNIIGRWIISIPSVNKAHELIIKKDGSTYYAAERGKIRKVSKKGNCYYEHNNNAGEYYKIIGDKLRLCDRQGDFTDVSGYSVKTIYYANPKTASTPKPKVEQMKVSSTKIKKELQSLYNELLGFKNNTDFKLYGFDPNGPYYKWLKRAEAFDNKQNGEVLVSYGIVPGDVKMLGLKYVETRGQEDEYTRYIRGEIDAAIKKMK